MAQVTTDILPRRRWWLLPLLIALATILIVGAGAFIYRWRQPESLCARAEAYLAQNDYRNAALTLQRALQLSPLHQDATRLMVELTEKLNVTSSVVWHEQLVQLNPDSIEARSAWLANALKHSRMDAAERAIESAPEAFRKTGAFEQARGLVAIGNGRILEAESAFAEALKHDPDRTGYRLNLALARLQLPDAKKRAEAEQTLRELTKGRPEAQAARNALVRFLIRQKNYAEALAINTETLGLAGAGMPDYLTQLDLLLLQKNPAFPAAFERARAVAIRQPLDLAALLTWSRDHLTDAPPAAWTLGLEPSLIESSPVVGAWAELLAAQQSWAVLEALTAKEITWGTGMYMRHAFASLAAQKLGKVERTRTEWRLTMSSISQSREVAMSIAYFAHRAGWRPQMIEALWAATESPKSEWALRILHRLYAEEGKTQPLLRVATRLLALSPEDAPARNNTIILRLLLGENAPELLDAARQLHARAPKNAVFASTLAFALHRDGKAADGLALIAQLLPEQRKRPEIALYDAVLLAATGQAAPARAAAAVARSASLLPEEKQLLENVEELQGRAE